MAVAVATDLESVPFARFSDWCKTLSDTAQNRAAAFRSVRRYRHFVAGRILLAQLLAAELNYPPQTVAAQLSEDPDGRPCLSGVNIHCSISHSGSAVMAGFSQIGPIGVDIEQHRLRDFQRLVAEYFHPDEYRAFALVEPDQQPDWFYGLWTRKEAEAKARGEGLTRQRLSSLSCYSTHLYTVETFSVLDYTACILHCHPLAASRFQACYRVQTGEMRILSSE
ncbi:4'-phosphopantetheinyl transferase superfamily protein [Haliea sp. E1-2-M8]|uniref:4'-phosphopantetheinyl transferase family protein n=1 Tax=Haliea sp. E1-2-M8 TaxID=3064706 RepID=UPI00271A830E|nr:4'-phosphopantetheinyl transferase superfamily protein [Haliea sp. E1-2-M8]MDO8861113.1 4'-phosphopantetheinyl transferase superfamily protein [Haliea sp. E1-2-M8]